MKKTNWEAPQSTQRSTFYAEGPYLYKTTTKPEDMEDMQWRGLLETEIALNERLHGVGCYSIRPDHNPNIAVVTMKLFKAPNLLQFLFNKEDYEEKSSAHPLNYLERIQVSSNTVAAIKALHAKHKYFHCDIKLDNLLRISNCEIKLCDFECATPIENPKMPPLLTPIYSQLLKENQMPSMQSELFATGITLLQILTQSDLRNYPDAFKKDIKSHYTQIIDSSNIEINFLLINSYKKQCKNIIRSLLNSPKYDFEFLYHHLNTFKDFIEIARKIVEFILKKIEMPTSLQNQNSFAITTKRYTTLLITIAQGDFKLNDVLKELANICSQEANTTQNFKATRSQFFHLDNGSSHSWQAYINFTKTLLREHPLVSAMIVHHQKPPQEFTKPKTAPTADPCAQPPKCFGYSAT